MVEGDANTLGEVGAEQWNLGVALAEVVQHDEVGVHLHADANGLRGRAGGGKGGAQGMTVSTSSPQEDPKQSVVIALIRSQTDFIVFREENTETCRVNDNLQIYV